MVFHTGLQPVNLVSTTLHPSIHPPPLPPSTPPPTALQACSLADSDSNAAHTGGLGEEHSKLRILRSAEQSGKSTEF